MNFHIGKDPDAGKDWRQEEKGTTEDEMVGWHHRLNGHGFGQTLGVGDGQGSLACCSPWGHTVRHDWTSELNWIWIIIGRKAMTNLDSILKSRDITLPSKEHLVKAVVFPVVMYGCESWTVKKAEHQRINALELRCWRRLLRVPWTAWRSNQSILKEISLSIHWKDWYWGGRVNTLATWCEEQTYWKRSWYWERSKAGEEGATEDEMVGWHHWLDGHEFDKLLAYSEGQGSLACCSPLGHKGWDMTERLNNSNHYKEFK